MRNMRALRLALLGAAMAGTAQAEEPASALQLTDPAYLARHVCGPIPKRRTELYKPGVQLMAAAAAVGRVETADPPPLYGNMGTLHQPVSTRSAEAQRYFDQGMRFAYAFNHAEARRAFRQAQALDPSCAMCYWGEAYVLGPNINQPMPEEAVAPAFAAIAQALALKDGASPRERALIEALAKRYAADPKAERKVLDEAYAQAMGEMAARYPADDEIQVLFADALMNLQPWDYWNADRRTPKGRTAEQVAALERVLQRNPDHPGAIHFYIHTVEASTTPERAEAHADRLGSLMPAAGHLVHMPAHIYYRIGRYRDSLAVNLAAAKADEALLARSPEAGLYRYGYYPHNVHFVLVSAQMAGDGAEAIAAAEKLQGVMSDEMAAKVGWIQAIKTAPYLAHAQFGGMDEVLSLPDPGERFPFVRGTWRYSRGMAYVRAGDLAAAAKQRQELEALAAHADLASLVAAQVPAPEVLTIARLVLDGQMARARGDHATAQAALAEAVRLQDGLPYMEPPYWYYPVRQSLAASLLESGKAAEAASTFTAALMDAPSNAFALYGLMLAQRAMGDEAGSAATAGRFARAWAGGEATPALRDL